MGADEVGVGLDDDGLSAVGLQLAELLPAVVGQMMGHGPGHRQPDVGDGLDVADALQQAHDLQG